MITKHRLRGLWIDTPNRLRFGEHAPRYAERIWVRPDHCQHYIEPADFRAWCGTRVRRMSGRVISRWPESLQKPLKENLKLNYCFSHWVDKKSWADAGAVDFMLGQIEASAEGVSDGCRTRQDVLERFETLDKIWAEVQKAEQFPTRDQVMPSNFGELGGVLMHIGPGGVPVFSGAGCHRFAIARMLDRPFPAQLGVVHTSALARLPELRRAED